MIRYTDFFDNYIILEEDIAPFLFLTCLDYVLRMSIDLMKENDLILK